MILRRWTSVVAIVCVVVPACTPSSPASSSSSGPSGSSGSDAGSSGSSGIAGDGSQLADGTLLYLRHEGKDHDLVVARDLTSGDERVVTDLTGDGSPGWEIQGYSLSPDRRRIAIASLYGPTAEDTATGLATRAIWTLAVDGTDFRRLTPTFPKDAQGRRGFTYDVANPMWNADGSRLLYDFGSYWQDSTGLAGGSVPWIVPTDGGAPPSSFPTSFGCSVLHPARNPATGEFLLIHSVCVPGQGDGDGLYLYPADGSTKPKKLVASGRSAGNVDVFLEKASWISDGSGFLFIGGTSDVDWKPSLLAYDMKAGTVSSLVVPPEGSTIYSAAISPDTSKIVYCIRNDVDSTLNLHLVDVSAASATDTAITTDGKSCYPSF
ncbi:hypothetical protein AKJ09_05361 [Labilithrix luteola]|uniref:Uncharacterized protein n=1 Tax=Labilithrix luteola TaxID=1391654 RepID=A0A0K1PYW7_9BACT|nr:hypothetical protein [Labilithrix luteola]AKU98697.1 hypothetical protein AKJ09_05361 [Labilithrix luteola]